MRNQFKQLITHSAIYGAASTLNAILGFILVPLYAHRLLPEEFGTITVLTITAAFGSTLFQLGTGTAIFRSIIQRNIDKSIVLSTALCFTLALIIIFLSIVFFLANSLNGWLFNQLPNGSTLLSLTFTTAALDTIVTIPLAKLRIEERSITYSVLTGLNFLFGLILNITFVGVLLMGVKGVILANLFRSALYVVTTMFTLLPDLYFKFSFSELRELISFGIPLIPVAISALILSVADRYFLQYFSSLVDVGIYSLGYKIGSLLQLPIGAFQIAWPTIMFAMYDTSRAKEFYSRLLTYFCLVLGYLALIVALFSKEIVELLSTPEYFKAWQIVPLIALSQIMFGIIYVTAVGVNVKKRPQDIMIAWLIGVGIHLALNFVLIPKFGLYGAAVSTLIGYTIVSITATVASLRLYSIPYNFKGLLKLLSVLTITFISSLLIPVHSLMLQIAMKILLLLSSLVVLWWIRFFDKDEIDKTKIYLTHVWQGMQSRVP